MGISANYASIKLLSISKQRLQSTIWKYYSVYTSIFRKQGKENQVAGIDYENLQNIVGSIINKRKMGIEEGKIQACFVQSI
jgi:hypothetical protein